MYVLIYQLMCLWLVHQAAKLPHISVLELCIIKHWFCFVKRYHVIFGIKRESLMIFDSLLNLVLLIFFSTKESRGEEKIFCVDIIVSLNGKDFIFIFFGFCRCAAWDMQSPITLGFIQVSKYYFSLTFFSFFGERSFPFWVLVFF